MFKEANFAWNIFFLSFPSKFILFFVFVISYYYIYFFQQFSIFSCFSFFYNENAETTQRFHKFYLILLQVVCYSFSYFCQLILLEFFPNFFSSLYFRVVWFELWLFWDWPILWDFIPCLTCLNSFARVWVHWVKSKC